MKYGKLFILSVCAALILTACSSQNQTGDSSKNTLPDNTPVTITTSPEDILPLDEVKQYSEEELLEKLKEVHQDTLTEAWGRAAGMLSGFYGDIWYYDTENEYAQIIIYYDYSTKLVEYVKFSEKSEYLRGQQTAADSSFLTSIPVSADVLDEKDIPEISVMVVPEYVSLSKLPDNYTLEDAKNDGCVSFEGTDLISGEDIWNGFLYKIRNGEAETVRIAKYYPEDNSLYLTDLTYNGVTYLITTPEGNTSEYKYLNHYTEDVTASLSYSVAEYYILTNDKYVTYKQLELSLVSSSSLNQIEHYRIYTSRIKA